jgi:16S rRNA (adenine1518-N6/adenine1519-N6)-dimethyltransferase
LGPPPAPSLADLDLASREGVRAALDAFGLRLRPSRGQHFLTSHRILDRILDAASVGPDDVVLEVGAGIGTLTVPLAHTGARVIAVEVDARFIPVLRAACTPFPGVRIVHADAMRLVAGEMPGPGIRPSKVVANLPYSIASPLLISLLEQGAARRYVVMVQQEVGHRIVAAPGSKAYGLLSVAVQAHARAEVVARVPAAAFFPPPQVRSLVVRLVVPDEPPVSAALTSVVMSVARAAFGQRRKMLRSALQRVEGRVLDADEVVRWCGQAGIDHRRRGEDLSVAEFARLAAALLEREGA